MNLMKIAVGVAMAGALGFGALGGAGFAQAKPHDGCDVMGLNCWVPGDPPGQNPFGPPGQVKKDPLAYGVPPVWAPSMDGVPPGHWGETWSPWVGVPELPVVWNNDLAAWGVWWADQFIPRPFE
jgi:hypothetical protein